MRSRPAGTVSYLHCSVIVVAIVIKSQIERTRTHVFIAIKLVQVFYRSSVKLRRKNSELVRKLFTGLERRVGSSFLPPVVRRALLVRSTGTASKLAHTWRRLPLFVVVAAVPRLVVGGNAVGDLLQRMFAERHELDQFAAAAATTGRRRRRRAVFPLDYHVRVQTTVASLRCCSGSRRLDDWYRSVRTLTAVCHQLN